jgi:hypothetical protein
MNSNIKLRKPASLKGEALEAQRLPAILETEVPVETMPELGSTVAVEKGASPNLVPDGPNEDEGMGPVIAAIEQIVKAFMPAVSQLGNRARQATPTREDPAGAT